MPANPPGPGYKRRTRFRGWPDKFIDPKTVPTLDGEQLNRFMIAFQSIIADELAAGRSIHVYRIGEWAIVPNTFKRFANPKTGEIVPKKRDFRVHFWTAHKIRKLKES